MRQKKIPRQPAPGKITSYQVKQLNKLYTEGSAAFGSIVNLKNASVLPEAGKIVRYLQSKVPNTKYRQFRKSFRRLKAVAYRKIKSGLSMLRLWIKLPNTTMA